MKFTDIEPRYWDAALFFGLGRKAPALRAA